MECQERRGQEIGEGRRESRESQAKPPPGFSTAGGPYEKTEKPEATQAEENL